MKGETVESRRNPEASHGRGSFSPPAAGPRQRASLRRFAQMKAADEGTRRERALASAARRRLFASSCESLTRL